ncbi:hypothetical protein [Phenylobacterium sp. J367]|uniref:hypothetical protein n=1 Tax=Phenylobacterium sp. J367 TaxID=2898435 RepID=UPI0021519ED5|nr:hypothetical protein [Phenylobacterium sp. J367]MCR5877644.1 hypothetical protein [Phenylobacterium sp. J367]
MRHVYENPELQQQIERAKSFEDLDAALVALSKLVPSFVAPQIRGRQMFAPGLDAAVTQLPRRLGLKDVPLTRGNSNACIVATRFYGTGGHSKVAADITSILGAERMTLLFTDIYRQLNVRQLPAALGRDVPYKARAVQIMTAPTLVERVIELYMALAAIRPDRIFLIQNHMDAVAVAATWPFRDVVEFVHHADHMPTLGATLKYPAHLDLTYMCHASCREAGVEPEYVGMTIPGLDAALAPQAKAAGEPFRFATCGAPHKYRQPAGHRWTDFAAAALRRPGSELLHIGPFDEGFQAEVAEGLTAAGVDPARYRFLGAAPDLKAALIEHGVDAYLASYPDTGGRANLEAVAAGLAPIVPVPSEAGELLQFNLPLPYWVRIEEPSEVADAVDASLRLNAELRAPAGRARLAAELGRFERRIADIARLEPLPEEV